jgi:hypothetical protein
MTVIGLRTDTYFLQLADCSWCNGGGGGGGGGGWGWGGKRPFVFKPPLKIPTLIGQLLIQTKESCIEHVTEESMIKKIKTLFNSGNVCKGNSAFHNDTNQ